MAKIFKIFLLIGVFAISACGFIGGSNAVISDQYVAGSDDIPLISGLQISDEDSTSFDTMLGNIVVSNYTGKFRLKTVADFYSQTLPQLGWKLVSDKDGKMVYNRNRDKLEISFKQDEKKLNVRFFISSVLK